MVLTLAMATSLSHRLQEINHECRGQQRCYETELQQLRSLLRQRQADIDHLARDKW